MTEELRDEIAQSIRTTLQAPEWHSISRLEARLSADAIIAILHKHGWRPPVGEAPLLTKNAVEMHKEAYKRRLIQEQLKPGLR